MAKTKERQASALTLAAQQRDTDRLILRALRHNTSANSPASLAQGLAVPLAGRLADSPGVESQVAACLGDRDSGKRAGIGAALTARASRKRRTAALPAPPATWGGMRGLSQPGPILREPVPIPRPPAVNAGPVSSLGPPLGIRAVAEMLGCSPWTVRQTLIPRGLPHFRFRASGRLTFYKDQVIRWVESQQGGNTTS